MSRNANNATTSLPPGYRIARFREADLPLLIPLAREVFHRRFTLDLLKKKYGTPVAGVRDLSSIAYGEDGQPVAFFGALPWRIRHGDTTEVAAQVVDVMTHPAHQGRSLFSYLAELTARTCREEGVAFLFGFANDVAFPRYLGRLGYRHLGELMEYRRRIRTLWIERVAMRLGPLYRGYERALERILARSAAPCFENSFFSEGSAGTLRDEAFFAYKAALGGSRIVEFDGCRVWLKVKRGILIGDVDAEPEAVIEKALRRLEAFGARVGVHQMLYQCNDGTRLAPLFASRSEVYPVLHVIHKGLSTTIPVERLRFSFGDLDSF